MKLRLHAHAEKVKNLRWSVTAIILIYPKTLIQLARLQQSTRELDSEKQSQRQTVERLGSWGRHVREHKLQKWKCRRSIAETKDI